MRYYTGARNALMKVLAQTPGQLLEAIAEYEAALRTRPNPQFRRMADRLRDYIGAKQ